MYSAVYVQWAMCVVSEMDDGNCSRARGDVQQYVVQESMGWAGDLWWWVNGRPRNWIRDISRERLLLFSMEEKKVINQGSRLILPTGRTFATNFLSSDRTSS